MKQSDEERMDHHTPIWRQSKANGGKTFHRLSSQLHDGGKQSQHHHYMTTMSVGHLCEHCGQGRVRPFHFSFDEAVVTCDNVDCESRLEVSPWSCVVNRNLRDFYLPRRDQGHIKLWSRSSSSSSGFQSDIRSPLLSPARSYDSVTDREVEHFLQYLNSRKHKSYDKKSQSCTKPLVNNENFSCNSNSYASFFELLDGLDLDPTNQASKVQECLSHNGIENTGLDTVTSELESWMKGFESPMPSIKKETSEKELEAQQSLQCDVAAATSSDASSSPRLYIPSRGSAFSQVSPKKECTDKKNSSCSPVENVGVSVVEKSDNNNASPIFEKPYASSICDMQFLSPATSAVSDDSGYEDSGLKTHSVPFLPSLSDKKDPDCARVSPKKQKRLLCTSVSDVKNDIKAEVHYSNTPHTVSSEFSTAVVIENPSDKMDIEQSPNLELSVLGSSVKEESSQPEEIVPPRERETTVVSAEVSDSEINTQKKSCSDIGPNNTLNTLPSEVCSQIGIAKLKKPGRPRGRPRKEQVESAEAVPLKRGYKRRKDTKKDEQYHVDVGNASLRKGLASLLQTPTLHIKKEGKSHNLTTLSLRSRLNVKYSFSL